MTGYVQRTVASVGHGHPPVATAAVASSATQLPARATQRRTRLLVVGALPPPVHGCSVFTQLLLQSKLAAEFDVAHLDITDPRDVGNIGRFNVGNVALAVRHAAAFVRLLRRAQPDVTYIQVAQNTWGFLRDALFLAPVALTGRRLVVQLHGDSFDVFRASAPAPLRLAADAMLRAASSVVVQGRSLVPMLRGIVVEDRVRVVPNGVPDVFGELIDRRGRSGPVRILYLSNLTPAKGYLDLVRAASQLLGAGVDAQFDFAGAVMDASAFAEARRWSAPHAGRIRFLGVADAMRKLELLEQADILALPSHSEAQPLVLLEAMAAGLPVISTRRGAIPETVIDGQTGILIEPRRVDALADALARLIAAPAMRIGMGSAGRARFLDYYTVDRWVDDMISVFRSVADND